ncbi:MAG: lipoyl domain-containing protein [Flavihumibacter sp.]
MAEAILMPRLSDTMTEGVIAAWHKKVGDPVKKGELLAEVETDKATMDLESYKDGTLLHIGTEKGGKLQVTTCWPSSATGEDISDFIWRRGADHLLHRRRRHLRPPVPAKTNRRRATSARWKK